MIDNTNTNTNTNRPLMKEQIVDCGEETQQVDVGYSWTKTKVETEGSQINRKEKDKIMNYGCTVSSAKSKDRDVVKVVVGVGGRINWTSTFCLASG